MARDSDWDLWDTAERTFVNDGLEGFLESFKQYDGVGWLLKKVPCNTNADVPDDAYE